MRMALKLALSAVVLGMAAPRARLQVRPVKEQVDIYEDAFKPTTVFRGKTLIDWAKQLRDADPETGSEARKAFEAMGANAVPFLLVCQERLDWKGVAYDHHPSRICELMGDKAIAPLVRLFPSELGALAFFISQQIVGRHRWDQKSPTPESLKEIKAELARVVEAVSPHLRAGDATTRSYCMRILADVVRYRYLSDWDAVATAARKLMDEVDPDVQEAATELLVALGIGGHSQGLTRAEAEAFVKDPTRPIDAKLNALVLITYDDMKKQAAATQPSTRPAAPHK